MSTPLVPQEVFLLERYSSVDYFRKMRDAFASMVKVGEDALEHFMRNLPPDYRNRPVFEQPDATWGETVLPNLRATLAGLDDGLSQIKHGDMDGLGMAGNVVSAFTGMRHDFNADWMPKDAQINWDRFERSCDSSSFNIAITARGDWERGSLTFDYQEETRGELAAPPSWPVYRLDHAIRVKSGGQVTRSGVYLPDIDAYAAQFLIQGYDAWEADIRTPQAIESGERNFIPTTWTLVKRIAGSGGGVPGAADQDVAGIRLRSAAAEPCPREGYWFTPARLNSRRTFRVGELMPEVGGDYGVTIWQWDEQQ
jgi:hypothetical protein